MSMNNKKYFKDIASSLIITAGLLAISAPELFESMSERSGERQEKRAVKQGGREVARNAKAACKEGDQKSFGMPARKTRISSKKVGDWPEHQAQLDETIRFGFARPY